MFKKFLWLIIAVVFLCSPLWAEEDNPWDLVLNNNTLASADQQQPTTSGTASSKEQTKIGELFRLVPQPQDKSNLLQPSGKPWTPTERIAGPQDFCSFTSACFDANLGSPCDLSFGDTGTVCSYQDPAKNCPPLSCTKVYPFKVNAIHVLLSNCNPTQSCLMLLTPSVRRADFTNPACPRPGNVICSGPAMQIILPPNTFCQEFVIPLDENCCLDTTYFACLTFDFPNGPCGSICHDITCDPCCDYLFTAGGLLDPCQIGLPGNFAIWTDGFLSCQNQCVPPPPPPDTLRNHFKVWRITPPTIIGNVSVTVQDQFSFLSIIGLNTIDFLSNPARKVVGIDTSEILRPDDHLTWYRVNLSTGSWKVDYVNQFEDTSAFIDTLEYLLLPTQKEGHPAPDSLLGHYTAYEIRNANYFIPGPVKIQDQFDILPESLINIRPAFFLAPAQKNNEPRFDPDTHYVAYWINPVELNPLTRVTIDQFGQHVLQIDRSELLLVPTKKKGFVPCTYKPNDCNGDGKVNLADIICDVNVVFKGFPKPVPNCRCDSNCDNACNLVDIIYKKNYVFGGGPQPVPCKECCIPLP